jgi:GT2 family glycosyltransferase
VEATVRLSKSFQAGKIGIVTVLYNSSDVLPDFFRSLHAQTYSNFVVYAVDNASSDDSVDLCRQQGPRFVMMLNAGNIGFASGTNQGILQALKDGCETILLLNNDVSFEPDFLQRLVEGRLRHQASMVAPLTYYHEKPSTIWAAGGMLQKAFGYRPVHIGMGQEDTGKFSTDRIIQFAPGSCILIERSVFAAIGLLDETYFMYWEDADFAVRALKEGLSMHLISAAKLWHKVSSLAGLNSPFQRYYAVRNHALYIRKHCSGARAKLLCAIYLSAYWLAGLRKRIPDPRIAVWREGWRLLEPSSSSKSDEGIVS